MGKARRATQTSHRGIFGAFLAFLAHRGSNYNAGRCLTRGEAESIPKQPRKPAYRASGAVIDERPWLYSAPYVRYLGDQAKLGECKLLMTNEQDSNVHRHKSDTFEFLPSSGHSIHDAD